MKNLEKNICDNLIQTLIKKIAAGEFENNVLPSENNLCQMFDVSRTSLRSALQFLVAKGIILKKPKTKTVILDKENWDWFSPDVVYYAKSCMDDKTLLYHVGALRLTFEPQASALCALNSDFSDLSGLDDGNNMMRKSILKNDYALFTKGDITFHQAIFKGTHNPFFLRLSELILNTSLLSIEETLDQNLDEAQKAIDDHCLLMEAIRFKNPAEAQKIMKIILKESIAKIFKDNLPNYYNVL
ncbi:MAG: FCD domain-containing protein [Succinatimonas sp.]|nr:FCD domain-containing protein [Succinatimonas sp.]